MLQQIVDPPLEPVRVNHPSNLELHEPVVLRPDISAAEEASTAEHKAMMAEDGMAAAMIGGILLLAFLTLVVLMVIVNIWTISQ